MTRDRPDALGSVLTSCTASAGVVAFSGQPGFIDAHMHSSMVQLGDWVDLSPMATPTAEEVFDVLRSAPATSTG